MALTPAEKQQRYRERQKIKEAQALKKPDLVTTMVRKPFFERYQEYDEQENIGLQFDLAGFVPPDFSDDSDGTTGTGETEKDHTPYVPGSGSIGRAEMMVAHLLNAITDLAELISQHKKDEISDRIAEIEQSNLSDPAVRKKALADIVRLQKMRDQLDKQVRFTFPQWKVQDE